METTPVGTSWVLPPAVDEDSEQFSVTSYELHYDEHNSFELQVTTSHTTYNSSVPFSAMFSVFILYSSIM